MIRSLLWLSALALMGCTVSAQAQSVWTYGLIGPDGRTTITAKPPMDISYPRANEPVPMYDPSRPQGVRLTPSEEAARRRAPQLIILLDTQFHN